MTKKEIEKLKQDIFILSITIMILVVFFTFVSLQHTFQLNELQEKIRSNNLAWGVTPLNKQVEKNWKYLYNLYEDLYEDFHNFSWQCIEWKYISVNYSVEFALNYRNKNYPNWNVRIYNETHIILVNNLPYSSYYYIVNVPENELEYEHEVNREKSRNFTYVY